ncbi:uncharacterized protein LOC125211449 [Salvia hispanica]|uniref:uncharacterized protein LOC125211449 n=1 Tax=Salvia hispanica TaxID=49212 RepID=UPI002009B49A|nr:uncharacterized protein LOC125211449 [Salvia hispanica]
MVSGGKPPLPPSDRRRYARKIDPAVTALLAYMEIEYKMKPKWCHKFTKALAKHVFDKLQSLSSNKKKKKKKKQPNLRYVTMAQFTLTNKTGPKAFSNPPLRSYCDLFFKKYRRGSNTPNPKNEAPSLPVKPKPLPRPNPSQAIKYVHMHATSLASNIQKEFNLHGHWSKDFNHDLIQLALDKLRSNSPVDVDADHGTATPSNKHNYFCSDEWGRERERQNFEWLSPLVNNQPWVYCVIWKLGDDPHSLKVY